MSPIVGGPGRRASLYTCTVIALAGTAGPSQAQDRTLFDLSIEELAEVRVTSVSRREESVSEAPAAVHVITAEEIGRSGVRNLPEALRLAPGVEVVRESAHSWSISMRGFNHDLSNKLLVLIDGRSVYSPLFGGVFWDVQDTLLEDIERIEVIAGPGGSLWGANAVNGVINVITRSAWETQGGFLRVSTGTEEPAAAGFRLGGAFGENLAARAYVKYFDRDGSRTADGEDAPDDWHMGRGGFRMDFDPSQAMRFTLQGDIYSGKEGDLVLGNFVLGSLPETDLEGTIDVGGHNLLGRWDFQRSENSALQLQVYFDHTERDIPGSFAEERDTLDVDFQHYFRGAARHNVVWGAGYRNTEDELQNTQFATFVPPSRRDETVSIFLQDEIELVSESLFLTLGSKWEDNNYTGTEAQPNVRLSWTMGDGRTLWAAVARAVRIPARLEEDLVLTAPVPVPDLEIPFYARVMGNDQFQAEELLARSIGYRFRIGAKLSFSLAVFRHDYDKLQTNEIAGMPVLVEEPRPYLYLPLMIGNGMEGETQGGTLTANWQALPLWRLQFQYAYLDIDLRSRPGSSDQGSLDLEDNSPENQGAIYSYLDLPWNLGLFTGVRYVDALPGFGTGSHTDVDLSLTWDLAPGWRLSLIGKNLAEDEHFESAEGFALERRGYLELERMF